ncbi:hypothetical protein, partial [Mesorhizobium sp. BHbdii]
RGPFESGKVLLFLGARFHGFTSRCGHQHPASAFSFLGGGIPANDPISVADRFLAGPRKLAFIPAAPSLVK